MTFSMNKSKLIADTDTAVVFVIAGVAITIILLLIASRKFKGKRKKVLANWVVAWFTAGTILFTTGFFGRFVDVKAVNTKTFSKKELTRDLKQLEKCIMDENPLYFADREKLQMLFKGAYEKIREGMTEFEFYRLVNPIVAEVRCGHTNLNISEGLMKNREETAQFFPLKVTLVGNELYLLEDDLANAVKSANAVKVGDKILSINGRTSGEIIDILIKNISGDGNSEAKQRYIISKHFNSRFYDFVDSSDSFKVELIGADGAKKTVNLKAKYRGEFNTTAWSLHFSELKSGSYYESKINKDYAVLTIHIFMEDKDKKFDAFLEDFFSKVREQNIDKLIIDIRGNYGGGPGMPQALMSHLVKDKMDYFNCDLPLIYNIMDYEKPISPSKNAFNGKIVVLTDGAGFSTTGHFAALMKYHKLGILVGGETDGTYVCSDSSKDIVLDHTRMRLHYSTKVYEVAVKGFANDRGIAPDIYVSPSIEDMLNKKDVIMERGISALGL